MMISINKKQEELIHPSRLKIERAKKHVNDLNDIIIDFLADKPFELWSRYKKKPSQRFLFVKQHKDIPTEVSLIIGDAIHNLKSALDILAFRMVGDKAPTPQRVLFPFASSEKGLQGSIGNRQLGLAGEKVVDTIKGLQPYAGGNKLLYGIQILDTKDKHHFVITTGQVAHITGDQLRILTGTQVVGPGVLEFDVPTGKPIIVQDIRGTRAQRRNFKPFEEKVDFQPPFHISFGPGQGFDGRPVVPTLMLMTETVEEAIVKISSAFFS